MKTRRPKSPLLFAVALISLLSTGLLFCNGQPSAPSPVYVVHIPGLRASSMAPDEKYLAALVVQERKGAPASSEVQVWDFRGGTLFRTRSLSALEPRPGHTEGTTYLRYTSDGQLLALYTGGDLMRVLRAADLEELRVIRLPSYPNANAFEISPAAHRAAVRLSGDVRVYDLDSGEEVRSWRIDRHPEFKVLELLQVDPQLDGSGLAWRSDGMALAISVADNSRCFRGGGTIYILDASSNKVARTFRIPLLPASIEFGTGDSLYVASDTCGGYFTHWALDLPIYDSKSGREIGKLLAGKNGVRGYLAISANKEVLVAYADREKTTFEGFEDTLDTSDEQWQVWDLVARKLVLTFPIGARPSLSNSGRLVYVNREQEVDIFPVPIATK